MGDTTVKLYKRETQLQTFTALFGNSTVAQSYINKNSMLDKGHLATKSHFVFSYEQVATNYYLNAVPHWHQCNNGNWKSVESTIKTQIESSYDFFDVISGTHEVLELSNMRTPIYLKFPERTLPVPKYIWKILHNKSHGGCIVFVQINNPFYFSEADVFCKAQCSTTFGLTNPSWLDFEKGYTFCCEIGEFLKKVPTAPKINCERLFQFHHALDGIIQDEHL